MTTATQKVSPTPADPLAPEWRHPPQPSDDNRLDTLRSLLTRFVG
jgi:hypothetical protein